MKREPGAALATALRWRWRLAVQVALALTLGATLYAQLLTTRYEATSVVSFAPGEGVGADELRVLLPRYPVLLSSAGTLAQVAEQTGIPVDELESGVRITTPANTANVQISVSSTGPQRAAAAANALAAVVMASSTDDALLSADVVAPAVPDSRPAGPPRRLIELAGLAVGLLAGAAAAVLAEQVRPRLWSLQDLRAVCSVPVVGRLPAGTAAALPADQALADPVLGGRVRSLRAELSRPEVSTGDSRVLLVTGASRGQGATTTAVLLAVATSMVRSRTLLIDADLQQPGVARAMGVGNGPGLARLLRGEMPLRRLARATSSALQVVATDQGEAADDLLVGRAQDVVAEARASFTDIIVDGPPLLEGDAGATLCTTVDGVLLVVQHGAPVAQTRDALHLLDRFDAPTLGIVAQRFPESREAARRRTRKHISPVVHVRRRQDREQTA